MRRPRLTKREILTWADRHHQRTGSWPMETSGPVVDAPGETWHAVDNALRDGYRGFFGGSSLAQLLNESRGKRMPGRLAPLTIEAILDWADAHYRVRGEWPTAKSGPIIGVKGESWQIIAHALRDGRRGLPGGSSIARLLADHRGRPNQADRPRLTKKQILTWADEHRRRTGKWPNRRSGPVVDSDGETWAGIESALRDGARGLPGGDSVTRLLVKHRRARNQGDLSRLTLKQILAWADAHHRRTGKWPGSTSGLIPGTRGEKWRNIDAYLQRGARGLRGERSLAQLLEEKRGMRNRCNLPRITEKQILAWADAHYARTGKWPSQKCGPIAGAPGETWMAVSNALRHGLRGMRGGKSLTQLLVKHRGIRNHTKLPPLTKKKILAWADAHHRRTGMWPKAQSGPIPGAGGETWGGVENALYYGRRGLRSGERLRVLLRSRREGSVRRTHRRTRLTIKQIIQWAEAYHSRTGRWPAATTRGRVPGATGESWSRINAALYQGCRGLPGGFSLARLLAKYGKKPYYQRDVPRLTEGQIVRWAKEYFRRTGSWPDARTRKPVPGAPGESWSRINGALYNGQRGLRGESSLVRLLAKHGRKRYKNVFKRAPLTEAQIFKWAKAHHKRTGQWPRFNSGHVVGTANGKWRNLDINLRYGYRGLPGGSSLTKMLEKHAGAGDLSARNPVTVKQIVAWANAHYKRTGRWPNEKSGPIPEAPGETWLRLQNALRDGRRGLPGGQTLFRLAPRRGRAGGSSLARLPAEHRRKPYRH